MSQVARQVEDVTDHLSHPDALYEIVDGQVVELPEMGAYSYYVAFLLFEELRNFLATNPTGVVFLEAVFVIDVARDLRRRPDVAFISFGRWPTDRTIPTIGDWEVVPDLAIEVISPNDRAEDLTRKIRDYFRSGVRMVWAIYPAERQAYIYTSPRQVQILEGEDELDGDAILPGFRLPMARIFRDVIG